MVVHFTILVLIYILTLSGSNKRKQKAERFQQHKSETTSSEVEDPIIPDSEVDANKSDVFNEEKENLSHTRASSSSASGSWEEDRVRLRDQTSFCKRLQKGSWVEVYSNSNRKWMPTVVKYTRVDSDGNKVVGLSFNINGKPKLKELEVPRDSEFLRPSSTANKLVFETVMSVLSQIPDDDLLEENSWEFTFQTSGTELMNSIGQPTAIYTFEEFPRDKTNFDVLMFKHRTENIWALAAMYAEYSGQTEMILVTGDGRNIVDFPDTIDLDFLGRVRDEMYSENNYTSTDVMWPPKFDGKLHHDHLATQIALDKEVLITCCKVLSIRNRNNKPNWP